MWRRVVVTGMAFSLTMILFSASAWAICVQEDLEGTWSARVSTRNSEEKQCFEACTIQIGPDGMIEKAGKYVTDDAESAEIVGGKLTITSGCVIEGMIETSKRTIYIDRGGIVDNELVLGESVRNLLSTEPASKE